MEKPSYSPMISASHATSRNNPFYFNVTERPQTSIVPRDGNIQIEIQHSKNKLSVEVKMSRNSHSRIELKPNLTTLTI